MGASTRTCPGCGQRAAGSERLCLVCGALIDGLAADDWTPPKPPESDSGRAAGTAAEPGHRSVGSTPTWAQAGGGLGGEATGTKGQRTGDTPDTEYLRRRADGSVAVPKKPYVPKSDRPIGPRGLPQPGSRPIPDGTNPAVATWSTEPDDGALYGTRTARPIPPVKQSRRLAGRVVLVVLLVGAVVGGTILVINHKSPADKRAERARYLDAHRGPPQHPPSLREVLALQVKRDAAQGEAVAAFCTGRQALPAQPPFVPGNLDQWFVLDGTELDARTLNTYPDSRANVKATTLAICTTSIPPAPSSQTCTYYEGTTSGSPTGTAEVRELQLEQRAIDVHELRTARRLGGGTVTAPPNCPERSAQGAGPVTAPLGEGDVYTWVATHLNGATVH